jgi:hypothetical protein
MKDVGACLQAIFRGEIACEQASTTDMGCDFDLGYRPLTLDRSIPKNFSPLPTRSRRLQIKTRDLILSSPPHRPEE